MAEEEAEKNDSQRSWQDFEKLIYNIYKQLEPLANVKHNDFILGVESNIPRQIDISIRNKIANHELLIIIQAKKLKKRADINVLGEFDSVIRDVRASKGVLVCNAGFTKSAKEYAAKKKIDLCTAHDASMKEWRGEIQIPVIKKSRKVSIKIKHQYIPNQRITIDSVPLPFPEIAIKEFLKKWERDELDKNQGSHYIELDRDMIKPENSLYALKTGIEYDVMNRYHFKFFKPTDYIGIKDYVTQNFTPTFIEFKENIPFQNDGTWQYIPSLNEISIETSHLQIEVVDIDILRRKMIRVNWDSMPPAPSNI
jgi:hypothetical protein